MNELLKPRTIFSFMLYATVCYLSIKQAPISDVIADSFFALMGFWFGEKVGRLKNDKPN